MPTPALILVEVSRALHTGVTRDPRVMSVLTLRFVMFLVLLFVVVLVFQRLRKG